MAKLKMDLPERVIRSIEAGDATLFLGAGASTVATDLQGRRLPSGSELADELRREFFGVRGPSNLAMLSELVAVSERPRLVRYVQDRFRNAQLSESHERIPWFRWKAIATTNYDCLVEKSYEGRVTLQTGRPVITEQDLGVIDKPDVPIIKLHGCCTRAESLVLNMSNLYERKRTAALLFNLVEQLHVLGPVIYIGYSLADQHIVEWIFELSRRLGQFRQPIVFVGSPRSDRWQRIWVERALGGEYLPLGFDGFMTQLREVATPPIGPSKIIGEPFSPCWADKIAGHGTANIEISEVDGEWQCILEYTINHEEGFACAIFERFDGPVDVSQKKRLTFELYLPNAPRRDPRFEALKLESRTTLYPYLLNTEGLPRGQWIKQSVNLTEYEQVELNRLVRIALADNGHRATLGQTYRLGLRRVRFE